MIYKHEEGTVVFKNHHNFYRKLELRELNNEEKLLPFIIFHETEEKMKVEKERMIM